MLTARHSFARPHMSLRKAAETWLLSEVNFDYFSAQLRNKILLLATRPLEGSKLLWNVPTQRLNARALELELSAAELDFFLGRAKNLDDVLNPLLSQYHLAKDHYYWILPHLCRTYMIEDDPKLDAVLAKLDASAVLQRVAYCVQISRGDEQVWSETFRKIGSLDTVQAETFRTLLDDTDFPDRKFKWDVPDTGAFQFNMPRVISTPKERPSPESLFQLADLAIMAG